MDAFEQWFRAKFSSPQHQKAVEDILSGKDPHSESYWRQEFYMWHAKATPIKPIPVAKTVERRQINVTA